MAFEGLSERLQGITRKLRGKARITESDLKEVLREVKFGKSLTEAFGSQNLTGMLILLFLMIAMCKILPEFLEG